MGLWLVMAVLLLSAYRYAAISALHLPLHYDEAQYVGWSLAPDWGYFSKPPMIAWVIGLARAACGPSEACVRLPAALATAGAALFAAAAAGVLAGKAAAARTALWVGLALATLPLVSFYGSFATTDSLLLLAWCAALWTFARASRAPTGASLRWWLATGLAAGVGLLSKYTMGVFAISALIWLLTDANRRKLLSTPGPWLAAALAGVLFAPNVLWNLRHGFATVQHTAEISRAAASATGGLKACLEFLVAQPFLLGLGLAVGLGFALLRTHGQARTESNASELVRFGWTFCWPMLAVIALQAFNSRAHANWAAPAMAGASIAAAGWLAQTGHRRAFAWALALNLVVLVAVAHGPFWLRVTGLDAKYPRNPWTRLGGWHELGTEVQRALNAEPALQLLSDDRRILSGLIVYGGPRAYPNWAFSPDLRRTDHYRLLYNVAERSPPAPEAAYLFVGQADRFDRAALTASFKDVRPLAIVAAPVDGVASNRFELIRVQGLRPINQKGADPAVSAKPR